MGGKSECERALKETIYEFIDTLQESIFTTKTDTVVFTAVKLFFKAMPPSMVMKHYLTKVYIHRDKIEDRNDQFFKENMDIFMGIPKTHLKKYKTAWEHIEPDNKDIIWEYFDTLNTIANLYKSE